MLACEMFDVEDRQMLSGLGADAAAKKPSFWQQFMYAGTGNAAWTGAQNEAATGAAAAGTAADILKRLSTTLPGGATAPTTPTTGSTTAPTPGGSGSTPKEEAPHFWYQDKTVAIPVAVGSVLLLGLLIVALRRK
jgi:hypothetical protein